MGTDIYYIIPMMCFRHWYEHLTDIECIMSAQYDLLSSVLLCIPFHKGSTESLSELFRIIKHKVNGGAEI